VSDASGRVLARRTEVVVAAGTTSMHVTLTTAGKRILRKARNLRVRVRRECRDLLAGRATPATSAPCCPEAEAKFESESERRAIAAPGRSAR